MNLRAAFYQRFLPKLISRPIFQRLHRRLFHLATSGMGVGYRGVQRRDEDRFLQRLSKVVAADATICDVGANTGQYARLARRAFPKARIFSFEPNPAAFARLAAAADALNIHPIPLGCGSEPGRRSMFDQAAGAGSPLATMIPGVLEARGLTPAQFDVELTTIDAFCAEQGIEGVDLLKVDTEGYEMNVLEGASRMLRERRVKFVQFEFTQTILLSHGTMEDMVALLEGYALHRLLYDGSLLPLDSASPLLRNLFAYQNIIAVRRGDR